jgi:hypothetical protein
MHLGRVQSFKHDDSSTLVESAGLRAGIVGISLLANSRLKLLES